MVLGHSSCDILSYVKLLFLLVTIFQNFINFKLKNQSLAAGTAQHFL